MRVLLYTAGWTLFCVSLFVGDAIHHGSLWIWQLEAFVLFVIWLVGLPLVMLGAVGRMVEELPEDHR